VRALIVGLGSVGQRHARNLRALRPDIELLSWRQRNHPGARTESGAWDPAADPAAVIGVAVVPTLDAAVAARPDVALICTPSSQHIAEALQLGAAGCHLFIEKPLSHTLAGIARLQAMATERALIVAIGSQWRFHPCVEYLRSMLWAARYGPVRRAEIDFSEYLPDWHPWEDYRTSYAARSALGGGVVLSQIHDYDLVHWLFGAPRSVMATGGTLGDLGVDVEDTVSAQLDCAAGKVFVRQTFAERERRRSITVTAAEATITCDLVTNRVVVEPDGGGLELVDHDRNDEFRAVTEDFLVAVEQRRAPRTALAEGAAVLRTALAVKESLRRRAPVTIE
jgi:predicted dehydrogenase